MPDARMPDGTILRFPEGTADDVIDRTARQHILGQQAPNGGQQPAQGGTRDYEVTAPDGRRFIVTAPFGASQDEVLGYAQRNVPAAPSSPPASGRRPMAVNPQTGEILMLGPNNQWEAPQRARNPQTGQELIYDGTAWTDPAQVLGRHRRDQELAAGREQNRGIGGFLDSTVRQVAQGVTFGFADEIAAGGNALVGAAGNLLAGRPHDFGGQYDRNLAQERARDEAFQRDNPLTSLAANVGGGVVGSLGPAGPLSRVNQLVARALSAAPGASVVRRGASAVGQGATMGAIGGAVQGFGEGVDGLDNRLAAAGFGALGGGVGGAAVGGVAPAIGNALAGAGRALNLNPSATAERQVLRALGRDGASLDDLAANPPGGGVTALVDSGGRNLQNLAARAANTPGPASEAADQFVELRRLGRPDRVAELVDQALGGGGGTRVMDEMAGLSARRAAEARPLYERAFGERLDDAALPRLAEFAADPIGQQAMQRGLRVIQMEHLAQGRAFNPEDYGVRLIRPGERSGVPGARVDASIPPEPVPPQPRYRNDPVQGRVVDEAATAAEREAYERAVTARQQAIANAPTDGTEAGRFVLVDGQAPNLRLMDAIKRGLDDELEAFRQPSGQLQLDGYGRAVNDMRRALVDTLDSASPSYAAARAAWAGPTEAMEALRRGGSALRTNPDIVAGQVANLSPEAMDFMRLGLGRGITDMTSDPSRAVNATRQLTEDRRLARVIDSVVGGGPERRMLAEALRGERNMGAVERAVTPRGGSQTHRLGAQAEDDASPVLGLAEVLMRGGGSNSAMWMRAAAPLMRRYAGINDQTSAELARILLDTDRARNAGSVARLVERARQDAASSARTRMLVNALIGGTAAGVMGQATGR